ncbi:hypothetical protein ACFL49_02700 [Candidatus Omnitrophota bacterium]
MKRFLLPLFALFFIGCTPLIIEQTIVNPTEGKYYRATHHYENGDFEKAIKLYESFLEKMPKSDLATPAKLNLGMSYYYMDDYKQSHATLKDIKIEDENIKAYIAKICKECVSIAGDEITKEEIPAIAKRQKENGIQIEILDAYLDRFGDVALSGKTNIKATVTSNGNQTDTDALNNFTISSGSWKKGKPIIISAASSDGRTGETEFFPDGEPPDEPDGLRVTSSSSNSIQIEWNENDEEDVIGYKLYYRLQGGSAQEVPDIIDDTDYEAIGLSRMVEGANRTFEFYLRAVDKMLNESDNSDLLEVDLPL